MSLGYETQVVNGNMINVPPAQSYRPLAFGQAYTGAAWMRQGVWNVPPVMPNAAMMSDVNTTPPSFSGYNVPSATSERGNAFHPTKSPLVFGLLFLIGGILMIQHIHYGK